MSLDFHLKSSLYEAGSFVVFIKAYVPAFLILGVLLSWKWTICRAKYSRLTLHRQGYLLNSQGESIPEVAGNTRFSRFSNGQELSHKGASKFDDKPYLIWNNSRPEIVLSTPETVKAFYSRQVGDHGKPPNGNMGNYFHRLLGDCVGVQNGRKWKSIRRVFEPHFSHQRAVGAMSGFEFEITKWRKDLTKNSNDEDGFTVDAVTACRIMPFKLIAISLFGVEVMSDDRFHQLLDLNIIHERIMLNTFFGRKETSRMYNALWTASKKDMNFFLAGWKTYVLDAIEDAEQNLYTSPIKEIYSSVAEGSMTEREFLQTVDEILFANLDVMSSIMAFLLINLSKRQQAQDELRNEILEQASKESKEPQSMKAYAQRTDTLLEYTCMESIRLCPAAWFTLPEHATADTEIGGYRIKAGTACIIDWVRLNTESPIWTFVSKESGQEITGKSFYPRRFEGLSPARYRWSFLRFGLGGRQCLGKNFGTIMMKQFLIDVLSHYKLRLDGQASEESVELREDRFTVTPTQDVRFVKI